jgi:hypothetical protein
MIIGSRGFLAHAPESGIGIREARVESLFPGGSGN